MNVLFMKLITGEEIVGATDERDNGYFVKWPLKLVQTMDPDEEKPRVRVEPYASQVKGHSIFVESSKIVYIAEPVTDLLNYYETTYGNLVPRAVAANEN